MQIGDPVVSGLLNPDACHDVRLTLKGKQKVKHASAPRESKQRQISDTNDFELPDLSERLQRLLNDVKALDSAYLERKSNDYYYVFNKGGRFCPTCRKSHRRSNGSIIIYDKEDASYGCFKDRNNTLLLGSVKDEISQYEDKQAVAALKADADFRKVVISLPWVAALTEQAREEFFEKLQVQLRPPYLWVRSRYPRNMLARFATSTTGPWLLLWAAPRAGQSGYAGTARRALQRLASLPTCRVWVPNPARGRGRKSWMRRHSKKRSRNS